MTRPPQTVAEFDAVMAEIDESLRKSKVAIHARGTHAGSEYSRRFGFGFPMATFEMVGTPGNYADSTVDAHIRNWYTKRYGDRLKIFRGPGYVALLIRGDPWRLRLPRIFGQVECVVERDLSKYPTSPPIPAKGKLPVVNVRALIEDLPQGLASELSDAERRLILGSFSELLDCMSHIERMPKASYLSEIRADILAAVSHLFSVPPHAGQSKWASSQAAEKLIKSFLRARGISFPLSHNFAKLSALSEAAGLRIPSPLLASVDTPAGVRYGDVSVSIQSAVEAHHASLLIGRLVSEVPRGVV